MVKPAYVVLLVAASVGAWAPNRTTAQEGNPLAKLKVLVGDSVDSTRAKAGPLLVRPNMEQDLFLFVSNPYAVAKTVSVSLQVGKQAAELARSEVLNIAAGRTELVRFAKTAAAPAPASYSELPAPYQIKIVLDDKTNKAESETEIVLLRPAEYLQARNVTFDAAKKSLKAEIAAKGNFAGRDCPVSLVLSPNRIPGLDSSKFQDVNLTGLVSRDRAAQLSVDNLVVTEPRVPGQVSFTADGYSRAFVFEGNLASGGGGNPQEMLGNTPRLHLSAAETADPRSPYKVTVEVDRAPDNVNVELEIFQANRLVYKHPPLAGDRDTKVWASVGGPQGTLLLKSEVKDWTVEPPVSGMVGQRQIRASLRRPDGSLIRVLPIRGQDERDYAAHDVIFDIKAPTDLASFVGLPATIEQGKKLTVSSRAKADSGIKEVYYFLGKKPADNKRPADAVRARQEGDTWTAELTLPDAKGDVEIGVHFVSNVGLSTFDTKTIKIVEPKVAAGKKPDEKPTTGKIEGFVFEADRLQPKLEVLLLDAKGEAKDKTTTDAKGKFVFEDVAPGAYKVSSTKASSRRTGTASVKVLAGKTAAAEIKLSR